MILISVDIGKKGAFSIFNNGVLDDVFDMPLKTIITKEASYKYKHKDKKIVYKTGAKKGERPRVVRFPKKTKTVIDFDAIKNVFREYENHGEVVFIAESQFAIAHGKSIYQNYGEIRGIARCYCDDVIETRPQDWQKHFKYDGADKEKSMKLAKNIFDGWEFKRHDQAESALIGKYFLDKRLS